MKLKSAEIEILPPLSSRFDKENALLNSVLNEDTDITLRAAFILLGLLL